MFQKLSKKSISLFFFFNINATNAVGWKFCYPNFKKTVIEVNEERQHDPVVSKIRAL